MNESKCLAQGQGHGRRLTNNYYLFLIFKVITSFLSCPQPPQTPRMLGYGRGSVAKSTVAACGILPDMSWKRVCSGSLGASVLVKLQREVTVSGDQVKRAFDPLPAGQPPTSPRQSLFDFSSFFQNLNFSSLFCCACA